MSLTISGKYYPEKELMAFVQNQISRNSILQWEKSFYQFILEWLSDTDFVSFKTSGSTGDAKTLEIEKEKMVKSAQLTGQFYNLQKDDKVLLCLPVDFIAGKMMVVRAFVLGLNLIPVKPSSTPLKNFSEGFDFAAMTPMQVYNTLKQVDGFQKLNEIKELIIGGGEIYQELLREIRKLKTNTYHTYGMTETLTHVALKKINGHNPDICFHALSGIKFETDDRNCMVILAPHLSEKKFITNDIIDLINEQSFNFIGRYDNVINSGGIKIYPELVEQKLSGIISGRYVISGLPDDRLGQMVILIIEGKERLTIDFAKTDLLKYEIPKQILYLDKFQETESKKIIRYKVLESIVKKHGNIQTKT